MFVLLRVCRLLQVSWGSYSRILNVWISQPLAIPVSCKRSLQNNNDIITKIINDPIIASTLKCPVLVCVCVRVHHSKTDIEVCWEWLPAPQRTKINGLVLLVSTKPQSSLLTAPKPLFTTHISRCVYIKVHTKAMTHESNIHTLSTQPTALSPRTSGFIYKCRLFSTDDFPQLPKNCHLIHSKNVPNSEMFWKFCSSSSARRQKCCANGNAVEAPANLGTVGRPDLTGKRRLCQCFLCSAFVERTVKVEVINEVKTQVPLCTCVE